MIYHLEYYCRTGRYSTHQTRPHTYLPLPSPFPIIQRSTSGVSSPSIDSLGDSISVLVLSVCVGTLGTGGASEHHYGCVVPMRRELGVVGCRV
jgi:hypothetical protein